MYSISSWKQNNYTIFIIISKKIQTRYKAVLCILTWMYASASVIIWGNKSLTWRSWSSNHWFEPYNTINYMYYTCTNVITTTTLHVHVHVATIYLISILVHCNLFYKDYHTKWRAYPSQIDKRQNKTTWPEKMAFAKKHRHDWQKHEKMAHFWKEDDKCKLWRAEKQLKQPRIVTCKLQYMYNKSTRRKRIKEQTKTGRRLDQSN